MAYLIYIPFGVLPSIIWLLFYLRKDAHPESNRMILKIFFWGMLIAVPAALLELGIFQEINKLRGIGAPEFLIFILYMFIGIALIEEALKYLIVKAKVLKHSEFDEPLDIMLYMIIAALGFAALENILVLLPLGSPFRFWEASLLSSLRFVGATFLHALCSGLVGYFLALSFSEPKKRIKMTIIGLGIAVFLHGLYNFSIITIEGSEKFVIPIIILVALACFVSYGFQKLKKMKSVCLS